ncbi:autolysin [Clostridium puniceum]|uniref:Autolysin n=1 Tax=Clostridium puniceum TaxID=29367 RepID=A0A1S8TKY5_9CLOT|nr:leucine-rich repeat protein [Clostridium puniceum]OOM78336.1 autolysin [Clostridium puniceum]
MKKFKLTKVIASSLIAISVIALNPIAANAEWIQDSNGWWYSEGSGYATGEKKINGKEYYFDSNGYMTTGWQKLNTNWRYYDKNGSIKTGWLQDGNKLYYISPLGKYILENQYINGFYLNSDGVATACTKVGDYEIDKGTGTLVRYNGNDASVVVPKTIGSVEIKSIALLAFSNCKTLSSITIPDSITNINAYAFNSCESLTSINIDENNKNYSSVDGVLFNKIKTTLIRCPQGKIAKNYEIPDSVVNLGESAFKCCYSLGSITVPGSVLSIGRDTFDVHTNTKFYAESERIRQILNKVGDIDASKIVLGKGYYIDSDGHYRVQYDTTVDGDSLSSNGALTTNLPKVANQSDFIFNSSAGIIIRYNGKDAILIIPSVINGVPVKEIGENAFKNNLKIVSVTIPDSVTIIGRCAFEGCSNLKSVTIPLGIKEVNSEAFKWCSNLTNINAGLMTASCIRKNNAYYEKFKNNTTNKSGSNS